MKLAVALLAGASLLPGALSFTNACKEGLLYCGKTLEQYHGYSTQELMSVVFMGNLDALVKPDDALFKCKDSNGGIQLSTFCYLGCIQPPNGDTCASAT
ncbi:hypothetical protein Asppvi_010369 [Aspergillus pseudoviridinutans]|uniref:Uncharacterized protein n=1 Tax=Aspergillus pseudoviridinutans TaxID=1517512 RepID=A0A9P3EWZ6_9EURO|nr:uncharacterized protein Asppvi_010369 [Aspergillus pseudoviridinutans]GIJ91404.1 hypothetical protein Asppvi_010369 [Aspergillus pseudoviridinutans]